MIDVVFAFDVEDAVNPESDDALLELCRIFTEEGVPVSLFVAGEKARAMRQRGRHDVIEAMRPHEICYHGNYWGDFPEPALSYGTRLPWDEAVNFALNIEAPGLHDVAETTGQFPVAWCVHQAQWCPQLAYALKLAGVRCCAGGPRGWIMNWLSWGRSGCVVSSQGAWNQQYDPGRPEELKPPSDPEADLAQVQQSFERLAKTQEFISFVGHPTCWVTANWGGLYDLATVFRRGVPGPYPRPPNVGPSQPRSEADQKAAFELMRKILQWIKTRSDVNLTSYAALCDRDEEDPAQWITWEETVSLARRVLQKLTYIVDFGTSFSPADILGMLVFSAQYMWHHARWPERVPVQRLLGPTEEPLHSGEPVRLEREHIFAGALAAYSIMTDDRRVPAALRASFVDVGPGELLYGLAQFVCEAAGKGELPESVEVASPPALPAAATEPIITDRRFGSSNRAPGLDTERLWDLLRWQSWSYRPAVSRA